MATDLEFKRGAIELLILKTLSWGPMHGYGIARWIQTITDDALRVEEGSLYPALNRLEDKGMVEAEWGVSENNRRAKFYHLSPLGRRRFGEEKAGWNRLAAAIALALSATPQEV